MECTDDYIIGFGDYGIDIYSIAEPYNPTYKGTYDPWAIQRADVEGDFLYVRWLTHYEIIDITTPSAPVLLSSVGPSHHFCQSYLHIDGRFAYFGGDYLSDYPAIASIWPPESSDYVYTFEDNWSWAIVYDVHAHGDYLYYSAAAGLRIYEMY